MGGNVSTKCLAKHLPAAEHMNARQLRNQFAQAKEQLQEAPEYMRPAKTAAQRQAERKAREEAAGHKQYKRWVHPDDFAALDELAAKLARKRERKARAG